MKMGKIRRKKISDCTRAQSNKYLWPEIWICHIPVLLRIWSIFNGCQQRWQGWQSPSRVWKGNHSLLCVVSLSHMYVLTRSPEHTERDHTRKSKLTLTIDKTHDPSSPFVILNVRKLVFLKLDNRIEQNQYKIFAVWCVFVFETWWFDFIESLLTRARIRMGNQVSTLTTEPDQSSNVERGRGGSWASGP